MAAVEGEEEAVFGGLGVLQRPGLLPPLGLGSVAVRTRPSDQVVAAVEVEISVAVAVVLLFLLLPMAQEAGGREPAAGPLGMCLSALEHSFPLEIIGLNVC